MCQARFTQLKLHNNRMRQEPLSSSFYRYDSGRWNPFSETTSPKHGEPGFRPSSCTDLCHWLTSQGGHKSTLREREAKGAGHSKKRETWLFCDLWFRYPGKARWKRSLLSGSLKNGQHLQVKIEEESISGRERMKEAEHKLENKKVLYMFKN